MAEHTSEPWEFHPKLSASENHKGYNVWLTQADGHGPFIADFSPMDQDGIKGAANVRRAVAAVNACNGISTAALEPSVGRPSLWATLTLAETTLSLMDDTCADSSGPGKRCEECLGCAIYHSRISLKGFLDMPEGDSAAGSEVRNE